MNFTEVTGAVENLDKMDWANLNLFFPRKLQIANLLKMYYRMICQL